MEKLRIAVAVSPSKSDLYFANRMMRLFDVTGVIVEKQFDSPTRGARLSNALRLLPRPVELGRKLHRTAAESMRAHFAPYCRPENATDFGDEGLRLYPPSDCKVCYTSGCNRINAEEYVHWLRNLRVDVVAVCGTSVLHGETLAAARYGFLNLHGGLSQRYRGLNTTEWAIYNSEPEYVGATVHFIAPGIDDGPVAFQGRPDVAADDHPNRLYEKVVSLGVRMMAASIEKLQSGSLTATQLPTKGTYYSNRSFTPNILHGTWKKVRQGVIADYVADKANRDRPVLAELINDFRNDTLNT